MSDQNREPYIINKQLCLLVAAIALLACGVCLFFDAGMAGLGILLGAVIGLANNRFLEWSVRRMMRDEGVGAKILLVLSFFLRFIILFLILFLLYPHTGFSFIAGFLGGAVGVTFVFSIKQVLINQRSRSR